MILTEEQARGNGRDLKGKTCPKSISSGQLINCLASDCGAWQFCIWPTDGGPLPNGPVGYCGMIQDFGKTKFQGLQAYESARKYRQPQTTFIPGGKNVF